MRHLILVACILASGFVSGCSEVELAVNANHAIQRGAPDVNSLGTEVRFHIPGGGGK